jgi:hypothetical protein
MVEDSVVVGDNSITGHARRIGHPDRREIPGAIAAGEARRILAIGLHPIAGFRGDEARRDDVAVDAQRRELPVQRVARWPGFVTDAHVRGRPELRDQFAHRVGTIADHPELAHRAVPLGDRNGDRLGMDIETDMTHGIWHSDRLRRVVALASRPVRLANPRYHDREPVASF